MKTNRRQVPAAFALVSALCVLGAVGCEEASPAGLGSSGADVTEACESLCDDLEGCDFFGGDGCVESCEEATDDCRSCLADSEICGDDCADECADDLGGGADEDDEPVSPATCDPGRCEAYCDAAAACDPHLDAADCVSGCRSTCGDGTFERSDADHMECVIMSATCEAESACCGSGGEKSPSDFCI